MAILLTGAAGIVGSEALRALLERPDPPPVRLLLRGPPALVEAKRRWLLGWAGLDDAAAARADVRAVAGDIRSPGLGLASADRDALAGEVTAVLHAAADTSFDQTDEDAYASNVLGTRHVLELARTCRRLERVGVVSTAYVAGARRGVIREGELDVAGAFFNAYERSKALAEADVRARAADLPVAVYRLGITVGRASDGRIARFGVIYPTLRLIYEGLVPMVPGDADAPLDLVPVDFAARAITHLLLRSFRPGACVHVVAGPARSFALGAFFEAYVEAVRAAEPGWGRHGYPTPTCVDPATFAAFVETIDLVANRRLQSIGRAVLAFTKQLGAPKWFATEALEEGLAGSGLDLPHARAWLPTLVRHALAARFRQPRWDE